MISNLDSAVIDANCEAMGIGIPALMLNAGSAISSILKERFSGKRIAFVCGNGNNGGDGIIAADMMSDENVTVFLLRPRDSFSNPFIKERLTSLSCPIKEYSEFSPDEYDVLADCALGTGIKGTVRSPYKEYIAMSLNDFKGTIVSVDVPSGLGTDSAVRPDITISFHDVKEGMNNKNSGEIIVSDIGIPDEAYSNIGPGDMLRYPIPSKTAHKGMNGKLLIIGGGPYYGAPAMSALAALRAGADVVRIAVPETCLSAVASFSPVFTLTALPGHIITCQHLDLLLETADRFDAVLIGMGLGTDDETSEFVRRFVSLCDRPMVIDADGLTALGTDFKTKGQTILTPHLGEYMRLGGRIGNDMGECVSELSKRTGSVILLKGARDIVSDGNTTRFNTNGNPGMTGAGTGDVLAGTVAGLLSKGMDVYNAAALGAFISGAAGDIAFDDRSYGIIATDVIDSIPAVLKKHLR